MVEAEPDPFKPLHRYDTGINQYQDPGLEEETRNAAIRAVGHALHRDVFFLDEELVRAELQLKYAKKVVNNNPNSMNIDWLVRASDATEALFEEMLSHGNR
jgi:hypothetical protein